jgi:hypothetical protein
VRRLARQFGLPIFSHVNDEAVGPQLEKLAALGLAGPWNTCIHCTGLAPSIWQVIADTGGKVSLSNLVEQTLCTGLACCELRRTRPPGAAMRRTPAAGWR